MTYQVRQLSDGRWGFYEELQLLATIGCYDTCQEVFFHLKHRNRKKIKFVNLLNLTTRSSKAQKNPNSQVSQA